MKNNAPGKKWILCFVCIIIILSVKDTSAALNGFVQGTVTDYNSGLAIANVQIYVGSQTGISQQDGTYLIMSIPGEHVVTATAEGYEQFSDQVTVYEAQSTVLNIEMTASNPNLPPPPEAINYPQKSYGNIPITWSTVVEASKYVLERATQENFFDAEVVYYGVDQSFNDSGLEDGIYFYRVSSENNDGRSEWRNGSALVYSNDVRKAIIIAGYYTPDDPLWEITKSHCDFARTTLLLRLFDEENITYLTKDISNPNRTDDSTKDNIQSAIGDAQGVDELFIYMHDHGARERFYLDGTSGIYLSPSELDDWMDAIQPESGAGPKIVLVIEACYSGSFIDNLTSTGSQERVIITSASQDQLAWFSPTGLTSFSSFFWSSIQSSQTILTAFINTSLELHGDQTPQLDADGDGLSNEDPDDGDRVANMYIGFQGITAAIRPIVRNVSVKSGNFLNGQTSAVIEVGEVFPPDEINRVWAVIYPPGFSPDSIFSAVIDIPTIELVKNGIKYEGTYHGFTDPGKYTITVIAIDDYGFRSDPNTIFAYQKPDTPVAVFKLLLF